MIRSGFRLIRKLSVTAAMALAAAGCSGFRTSSQVTLNDIPYYHPARPGIDLAGRKAGHFPVMLDMRIRDTDTRNRWQPLLEQINNFLDDQNWTVKLEPPALPSREYPDLFIGNPDMMGSPVIHQSDESGKPVTVLYTLLPGKPFKEQMLPLMEKEGCQYALYITIGFSEYFVRQKDWLGKKELYLGTGYRIPVKWLTSLDDPVEVLHFTGVLLDKEGRIVRSGAEGIMAARTASFFQSIVNLRNTLDDSAIKQLTTDIRREDLQGKPLSCQVALQNLVAGLLGREDWKIGE